MQDARVVDGSFISYPFLESGDTSTKVYNMLCSQIATEYSANQIELDTPMSSATAAGVIELPWAADSTAYFVGDTAHASQTGGLLSFTRTFANIPQSTTIPSGSEFYTFPGISGTYTTYSRQTITAISMTAGVPGITFTTAVDHQFSYFDNIAINAYYIEAGNPFVHVVNGNYTILESAESNAFRIDPGRYWPNQVSLFLIGGSGSGLSRCYRSPLVRTPVSKNVSTQTRYDYILPGVTPGVSGVLDINVPPEFSVTDVLTGNQTDTAKPTVAGVDYDEGPPIVEAVEATQTIPTNVEYTNLIENKFNIIIESSLQVWAGNILVQKTKTCKAK